MACRPRPRPRRPSARTGAGRAGTHPGLAGVTPKIVLSGEPLIDGPTALRPWRDSDLDAIVAACQDPDIVRWTSVPEQYGEVDAYSYLMQRYDALHAGATAPFAIVSAGDLDRLLGSISLMRFAWEHARGEVGYWLAPEARGRGHATRARRRVRAWGFRTPRARAGGLIAPARQ